jgi:hypothetical protein
MTSLHVLSGNTCDFTTVCTPTINLDSTKEYEAALLSLDMYNSIPNIKSDDNNLFRYSPDNGITWKNIFLETGSYELSHINSEIQRQMIINDDYNKEGYQFYIVISANVSTLKSIINITNVSYQIDFTVAGSIGSLLGFTPAILKHGYNESHNIVNIMSVNSILVNVDIISGSYVSGMQSSVLYSFYPNVPPGCKVVVHPNQLVYFPITRYNINRIRIWLTDQNLNPVDLRGETCTVAIVFKERL